MRKLKQTIIHPIFFAIYPVIFLFSHNIRELIIEDLKTPLIISIFGTIILWALINLAVLNRRISAIVTSLLVLSFFSYGHLVNLFNPIGKAKDNFAAVYFIVVIFLGIATVLFLLRNKNHILKLTLFLNLASFLLLIIPIYTISASLWTRANRETQQSRIEFNKDATVDKAKINPDIYYIISDSYGSNQALKDYYHYDNSEFTNFLKSKGFYVADRSKSNYPFTLPSMASSLNMDYLNGFIDLSDKNATDEMPLIEAIENNKVVEYLKSKDYKYYHFGNRSLPNEKNKHADFNYNYSNSENLTLPNFGKTLIEQTMLQSIFFPVDATAEKATILDERHDHYADTFRLMDAVSETVPHEELKFVYVHSLLTHVPYIFDDKGGYKSLIAQQSLSWEKNYIDQLKFSNKLLTNLIENILTTSKTPPIIILQSDEGLYPKRFRDNYHTFDWRTASSDELKEKFGIINAYYLPENNVDILYSDITPVNTFRIIFNKYFGEKLPLLDDRIYARIYRGSVNDMIDVTGLLKK